MRYTLPACAATGSPRVEYEVSRPEPGATLVQRRSADGPWQDVASGDLRMVLAAPTELARWLCAAMSDDRPAHRPRRDPSAARVNLVVRVHPDTRARLAAEARRTGESQGQVVDRLAHDLAP